MDLMGCVAEDTVSRVNGIVLPKYDEKGKWSVKLFEIGFELRGLTVSQ